MSQKNVVITGAGSGIGRATAKKFSEQGFFVILLGRKTSKLEEVSNELLGQSLILSCDLSQPQQIQKAVNEIKDVGLAVDALVNNAGVYSYLPLSESSSMHWQTEFATNLFGPVELTRLLLPYFSKEGASITNVSSTLGQKAVANTSSYSASKAAMIRWTESLAIELSSQKIRANCICPGIIETPIHTFHDSEKKEDLDLKAALKEMHPLKVLGQPEQIADAIYFLTVQSPWTTGSILKIDGGLNLN